MYQLRYLKMPSLTVEGGRNREVKYEMLLTITNDLGEELLYEDVSLTTEIKLLPSSAIDNNGKSRDDVLTFSLERWTDFSTLECIRSQWVGGSRSLALSAYIDVAKVGRILQGQDLYVVSKTLCSTSSNKVFQQGNAPEDSQEILYLTRQSFCPPTCDYYVTDKISLIPCISLPLLLTEGRKLVVDGKYTTPRYFFTELTLENSQSLCILEESSNGIARHVWDAGLRVSIMLSTLTEGCGKKTILELGTGIGVVSMALAKTFPQANVFATDLPDAEEITVKNAHINNVQVSFSELDWEDERSKVSDCEWDLIIATDCSYNDNYYDALLQVLCRLAGRKTMVVIAHKLRNLGVEETFFQRVVKHFDCQKEVWLFAPNESVHVGYYERSANGQE